MTNWKQVSTIQYTPVPKPRVTISMPTLDAYTLITMQNAEITLPTIVTGLQPNLFTKALAMGPENIKKHISIKCANKLLISKIVLLTVNLCFPSSYSQKNNSTLYCKVTRVCWLRTCLLTQHGEKIYLTCK